MWISCLSAFGQTVLPDSPIQPPSYAGRSLSLIEILILGIVCLAFIIFIRWVARFPSEFDRIGADLSLYAFGSAFSLFAAAFLEVEVFRGARKEDVIFLGAFGLLLSTISYFVALHCSEALRKTRIPNSTLSD